MKNKPTNSTITQVGVRRPGMPSAPFMLTITGIRKSKTKWYRYPEHWFWALVSIIVGPYEELVDDVEKYRAIRKQLTFKLWRANVYYIVFNLRK